jgi:hypothetical protein
MRHVLTLIADRAATLLAPGVIARVRDAGRAAPAPGEPPTSRFRRT